MAPVVISDKPLAAHGCEFLCVLPRLLEFVPTVSRGHMRAEQRSFLLKSCMTVGPDVVLVHRLSGTSHALAGHSRLQTGEQKCFIDFTPPHCLAGAGGGAGV